MLPFALSHRPVGAAGLVARPGGWLSGLCFCLDGSARLAAASAWEQRPVDVRELIEAAAVHSAPRTTARFCFAPAFR
jgi:hypothetical protein